jgi:hypothetical protein
VPGSSGSSKSNGVRASHEGVSAGGTMKGVLDTVVLAPSFGTQFCCFGTQLCLLLLHNEPAGDCTDTYP